MVNGLPNFQRRRNSYQPYRGFRNPVRPVLDLRHPMNGNLRLCFVFGDKFAAPVTQIGPYASELANAANIVTMENFTSASIVANDTGGRALAFNGSSTGMDWGVGYGATLSGVPHSLHARFMVSTFNGGFIFYEAATGFNNWDLFTPATTGSVAGVQKGNLGGINTTKASWTANTWYDITYTWDLTTSRIYVNGALDNSAADAINVAAAVQDTQFGRHKFAGGGTGSFLNGRLSIFRLWKQRVLTAGDAALLWAEPFTGITGIGAPIAPYIIGAAGGGGGGGGGTSQIFRSPIFHSRIIGGAR